MKIEIEDGNSISYYTEGSSADPAILLVSGSIFNYKQFFPILLPALRKSLKGNFRFILYDYVGISNSSDLVGDFDFLTIVEQHKQFMDALGVESAHHFGYSKGSLISQLMAAKYPNRVASLAGYGNPNLKSNEAVRRQFNERRQALSSIKGVWDQPVMDSNYDVLYDVVFLPTVFPGKSLKTLNIKEKVSNKVIKQKLKPMLLDTKIEVLEKLYKYYTKKPTNEELERYEMAIRGIKHPTLLMHGTKDEIVPIEASERLHSWIPLSILEKFEGFSHSNPVLNKNQGRKIMSRLANFIMNL